MKNRLPLCLVAFLLCSCLYQGAIAAETADKLISKVSLSRPSFNPTQKGKVELKYHLSRDAKVTVNVYDPDWALIRTIAKESAQKTGENTMTWKGVDDKGNIVPDEGYFFTIIAEDESGKKEIYDPTIFSGGVTHDIVDVKIDREEHTIDYRMPEMGRVMIRVGIQGGPLMVTIVDWLPRVKGAVTEYWNGKDKDGLVDLLNTQKAKMIVTYFSLPENSVITYGNRNTTYRSYKKKQGKAVTLKPDRGILTENISHHYKLPRTIDYAPELTVDFSNTVEGKDNDVVTLKGKTIVKVDLNKDDKEVFKNQQFEIAFFLDQTFYAEDEVGYTPFNWVWDLSQVEPGEHILTVNISGFRDQVGVLSRKVRIIK